MRNSNTLFLILVSLYLSGIAYIGAQALLYVDWRRALVTAILAFLIHICLVSLSSLLVKVVYHEVDSIVRDHKKSVIVGAVDATFIFPLTVIGSYLLSGDIGSNRYYFYASIMALIVFITTAIYKGLLRPISSRNKEVLRTQFDFQLEALKAAITAIALVLLGTAYSEVLTGMVISNVEMILVFYTTIGIFAFVLAPLMKSLLDLLGRFSDAAEDDWYRFKR